MSYIPVIEPKSRVARPLWAAMRAARQPLTIRELHLASGAHPNAIQLRLRRWERAGYVLRQAGMPNRFSLGKAAPVTPPTVNDKGEKGVMANCRDRLWRAMRILKKFDVPTLQLAADASSSNTQSYLNWLRRAGYVRILRFGARGQGEHSTYQLVRSTGRLTPTIRATTVDGRLTRRLYDPNTDTEIDVSPGAASLRPARAK